METQASITGWANTTFGEAPSFPLILTRANEEMAELLRAITAPEPKPEQITEEAADVAIVLCRAGASLGRNILRAIPDVGRPSNAPLLSVTRGNEILATCIGIAAEAISNQRCAIYLDIIINTLATTCLAYGTTLGEAIDRKMGINRQRVWVRRGDGHGQHVDPPKLTVGVCNCPASRGGPCHCAISRGAPQ